MMEEIDPNKRVIKVLIAIIVILVIILIAIIITKDSPQTEVSTDVGEETETSVNSSFNKSERKISNDEIQVLPTTLDTIYNNSSWCGTFQLVWNDMLDELTTNGTIEDTGIESVENLNNRSFLEEDLSEEYYYKKYGLKTKKLKTEIENAIKKKFNEKSDILDTLDWSEEALNDPNDKSTSRYLFYVMLKRDFEFENEFTILENGKFGDVQNVKYFGIDDETPSVVREQVEVLYYNSENEYAVVLKADDGDEIILVRNSIGKNFDEIYKNVNIEKEKYLGSTYFKEEDRLKVPNLDFNILKNYEELKGLTFPSKNLTYTKIEEAVQSIQFTLDNKGGSVKSEAAITTLSDINIGNEKIREFYFDDEFTIFLKESEKEIPYFAANISNITLFQEQ